MPVPITPLFHLNCYSSTGNPEHFMRYLLHKINDDLSRIPPLQFSETHCHCDNAINYIIFSHNAISSAEAGLSQFPNSHTFNEILRGSREILQTSSHMVTYCQKRTFCNYQISDIAS